MSLTSQGAGRTAECAVPVDEPTKEQATPSDRDLLTRWLKLLDSPAGACWITGPTGMICFAATADLASFVRRVADLDFSEEQTDPLLEMIRRREPTLCNDSLRSPFTGVARCMLSPILLDSEVVGILLAANRSCDYTPSDLRSLGLVASILAPHFTTLKETHASLPQEGETGDLRLRLSQLQNAYKQLEHNIHKHVALAVETEMSIRSLQAQHQELLDAIPAVIYVKDLEGRYVFANHQYLETFKLSRDDILGRTDFDVFNAHMAEAFARNDREVAESRQILRTEEIAPHPDGPHTYMTVKFPIHDAAGHLKATAGISTDITDRIRAQQHADSLTRRLALILDAVGDGVYGVDAQGRLEFLNPTAEQLLGWNEKELLGRKIHELIHAPEMLASPEAVDLRVNQELEPMMLKVTDDFVTFRTRDGRPLPVEYVCTPILDGERITGAVVTFRDLTERLAREAAERRGREAARKAEATIHELIAARDVQRTMLPQSHPIIDGFDIAGATYPRELVAGDFYDYIAQDDGSLIIVVGDASGHDLAAAVQMVEGHAALHAYLDCGLALGDLLKRLNQMLARHLMGQFISMFLGRLDPVSRTFEFAGAGHDAVLLKGDGSAKRLPSTGIVLGVDAHSFSPRFESMTLEAGDTVLLSTDGFQETFSPARVLFGHERLVAALRDCRDLSAAGSIERLYAAARAHAAGQPQADDMTAVVIRAL